MWETRGEERKTRAAVEHSRGEGTETSGTSLDQAASCQGQFKSSQNRENIFSVSAVPVLVFSTAALLASVPGRSLLAVSFAKLDWLE